MQSGYWPPAAHLTPGYVGHGVWHLPVHGIAEEAKAGGVFPSAGSLHAGHRSTPSVSWTVACFASACGTAALWQQGAKRSGRSHSRKGCCPKALGRSRVGLAAVGGTEDKQVAVIIPGLLYGADSMRGLAAALTARGYPAVVVPMEWWHWLPCLGGRSMRPVLERINFAVDFVLRNGPKQVPSPAYSFQDLVVDFSANPGGILKVGGSDDPDEYPEVNPGGDDFGALREASSAEAAKGRVALIGHSAGGWIARIFASGQPYGGYNYNGAQRVHSIVSLGSPHAPAPGVAFSSVRWLLRQPKQESDLRILAVGAKGIPSTDSSFTCDAYRFCGADVEKEEADGDGVTTLESALAVSGADTQVLEDITHAPDFPSFGPTAELARRRQAGQPWYGSPEIVDRWLPWLQQRHK